MGLLRCCGGGRGHGVVWQREKGVEDLGHDDVLWRDSAKPPTSRSTAKPFVPSNAALYPFHILRNAVSPVSSPLGTPSFLSI